MRRCRHCESEISLVIRDVGVDGRGGKYIEEGCFLS